MASPAYYSSCPSLMIPDLDDIASLMRTTYWTKCGQGWPLRDPQGGARHAGHTLYQDLQQWKDCCNSSLPSHPENASTTGVSRSILCEKEARRACLT